jgi:hypothetical protein
VQVNLAAQLNPEEDNNAEKMKKINSINWFLFWSILFIITPLTVFSIENSVSASQKQDSSLLTKSVSPHAVYAGIGYGSNMVLGSTYSQDQPYYYGALIYGYNNEFFATVSTFHLSAFDPLLAYHTFSLNYSHVFNSWFDISTGLSRFQVTSELTDTLFNSFFYGDITLGIDWRILYSKLSVAGILSETSSAYFQLRNSRYFQTPEFFNKKAYISFDPYASLLFGSLTETTTSEGTTIGISSPINSQGSGKNSSGGSGGTSSSVTSTFFGLMELDLGLPIGFNIGKITIEAEPGYVIPMFTIPDMPDPEGFVFMLSCSFKIF